MEKIEACDSKASVCGRVFRVLGKSHGRHHWFKEHRVFDYNRDEMMQEIRAEFEKFGNIYLIAKSGRRREETVGVLGVRIKGSVGTLGRWEPAVPLKYRESEVGEALLEEAFSRLRERQVSDVKCMLRFSIHKPQTARWHTRLYKKCGFTEKEPSNIMLLTNLSKVKVSKTPPTIANLQIIAGNGFSLKEFAGFTQRAYLTTLEDRAVHVNDPFISNPETVLRTLKAIREGEMGFSPPECWRVARVKDTVVGFTIGFVPKKSRYRPAHGVIGELGVFPEYRRKGIVTALITELFKSFRKLQCEYSLVGTLKTNKPAIAVYKKMRYRPTFELVDFEKSLT